MKVVAILTTYNEEIFIEQILQHYFEHGVDVYILDNESTDKTIELAWPFLKKNLINIQTVPRTGKKEWSKMLRLKERLATELDADWFIHADPDEFRVPPHSNQTLNEAIQQVDDEGYNVINFMEYTFVPTTEEPVHGKDFLHSMKYYYAFLPRPRNRLNAWKNNIESRNVFEYLKQVWQKKTLKPSRVELVSSGGHQVNFKGINPYPVDFKMRHYIVLSLEHAVRKYVDIDYDDEQDWRSNAKNLNFFVPSEEDLKFHTSDDELDSENPNKKHIFYATQV